MVSRAMRATGRAIVRTMNDALDRLRRPRIELLLVAAPESGPKLRRILDRLSFYYGPLPASSQLVITTSASWSQLLSARFVLETDAGHVRRLASRTLHHIYNVDYDANPYDGWELARLAAKRADSPRSARRASARGQLIERVARLRATGKGRVYLFGTGKTLARAIDRDFSDGHVVVCNTIVRDPVLWRHLSPDFVVAGDAIYHFGHTSHAKAFRRDLWARLSESAGATAFIYPEVFDAIVRREVPDSATPLIPIPLGRHTNVHTNLLTRFELPGLGNVLNQLLLPIGCTLASSIFLWGFDGRAPEDTLFWANSSPHSYPELVPTLRTDHPAFFDVLVPKGREGGYVESVHGDSLESRLQRAERAGFHFTMMHQSWTATLERRRERESAVQGASPGE